MFGEASYIVNYWWSTNTDSELNQLSNQVFDSDQYIYAFEDLFTNANFENLVQTSVEQIDITNSPMERFWLSYMETVEILYMHYHAMRTQNWEEYLTIIHATMDVCPQ